MSRLSDYRTVTHFDLSAPLDASWRVCVVPVLFPGCCAQASTRAEAYRKVEEIFPLVLESLAKRGVAIPPPDGPDPVTIGDVTCVS